MDLKIGKYYRDNYNRKLQYIGKNKNLYEFINNNPNGSKRHIRLQNNDPIINQLVLIEDEYGESDIEFPDDFDGGKVRRRKNKSKKRRTLKKKRRTRTKKRF